MLPYPPELTHGSGALLTMVPEYAVLGFRERTANEDGGEDLRALGFLPLHRAGVEPGVSQPARAPGSLINDSVYHRWVTRADEGELGVNDLENAAGRLGSRFDYLGPVYRMPGTLGLRGLVCPVPNLVVLRAATDRDAALTELAGQLGLEELQRKSRITAGIGLRHFRLTEANTSNAYAIRDLLLADHSDVVEAARLKNITVLKSGLFVPNDGDDPGMYYNAQWAINVVGAEMAWDIQRGDGAVFVAVIDDGVRLTHDDLADNLPDPGLDMSAGGGDAGVVDPVDVALEGHGTPVAGVAAGRMNNSLGIAGLAGECSIYPIKHDLSDQEMADGICAAVNFKNLDAGRRMVINLSVGADPADGFDTTSVDEAIAFAVENDCLICAGTGNGPPSNHDVAHNLYPARHPDVVACGASTDVDLRWVEPFGSDPEQSHYGTDTWLGEDTGVSVVAPGLGLWSTWATGDSHYSGAASGTSFATPMVAGLGALLWSQYPGLSAAAVRNAIERTAEKVHEIGATSYLYADEPGFPNGRRNVEMGYGRIRAHAALDFADVFIRDWPGDQGREPSTPPSGDYWCCSDIVVRPADDDDFSPDDPSLSSELVPGQQNWIYVRVVNRGPRVARDVEVNLRVTPWLGVDFAYPSDWVANDDGHIQPAPAVAGSHRVDNLAVNDEFTAKFVLTADQVDEITAMAGGPSILAEVSCENDYAWATASTANPGLLTRRNNLAQRNVSVVSAEPGGEIVIPVLAGHQLDAGMDIRLIIAIQKHPELLGPKLPFHLLLTPNESLLPRAAQANKALRGLHGGIRTDVGLIEEGDRGRLIRLAAPTTRISFEKRPYRTYELHLRARVPDDVAPGSSWRVDVMRESVRGGIRGGARIIAHVPHGRTR